MAAVMQPDPLLLPPEQRTCTRCGHVLVGEDEAGFYYQVPIQDPETKIVFMDRVHSCVEGSFPGWPHVMPEGWPDAGR